MRTDCIITDPNVVTRKTLPATISDADFAVTTQKFDYTYYFRIGLYFVTYFGYQLYGYGSFNGGEWVEVNEVKSTLLGNSNDWAAFILAAFNMFWNNPVMYDRTYSGIGTGETYPVHLLDEVTIGETDYSVVETKRDLIKNTKQIKLVAISN